MAKGIPKKPKSIEVSGGFLTAHVALDNHFGDAFDAACEQLLESGASNVVIDLTQIEFVSSTCFGIILSLSVKCISRGKDLTLKINQELVEVLDLLGIRAMIPTMVVRRGQKPKDFELQGSTLVVNRNLEAGDHVALHVWVRRLADLVGGSPTVDLTRVQQIDSRCIGILTELWVTCTQRGQPPTFVVSPAVHERLRGLNLDRVFTIRESSPRASS